MAGVKEKEFTIKKPEMFKVLDISTCHITKNDGALLSRSGKTFLDGDPIVYDYGEGSFVYCGGLANGPYKNSSPEFNQILEFANRKGCRYVCFDCDGPEYPDIPRFDW